MSCPQELLSVAWGISQMGQVIGCSPALCLESGKAIGFLSSGTSLVMVPRLALNFQHQVVLPPHYLE